jgi:hypothetical protein
MIAAETHIELVKVEVTPHWIVIGIAAVIAVGIVLFFVLKRKN